MVVINSIANYSGQFVQIVLNICVTPLYLVFLGSEAYGLIGFLMLMQGWVLLLDLGLSPTLGRQVAAARSQNNGFNFFRKLLKSFEVIIYLISIVIALFFVIASSWISDVWINSDNLPIEDVEYCLSIIGMILGLRLILVLYRSGIIGLEDQVWLNLMNILISIIRFVGGICFVYFISRDVKDFFSYQLIVSVIELTVFCIRFYSILPKDNSNISLISFHLDAVKKVAPFSLSIAWTAGLWVLLTQADKLVLTSTLSLEEVGYLSIVVLIANGILMAAYPISQAVQPQLVRLFSLNKVTEMISLYRKSTQFQVLFSMSLALFVVNFSFPLLYVWLANEIAAKWISEVLTWFVLGNAILVISGVQYSLQVAHGDLDLHWKGTTFISMINIPTAIFFAYYYGPLAAGITWFSFRLVWGLIWTWIVHKKFAPKLHLTWLINDVLLIVLPITLVTIIFANIFDFSIDQERFKLAIKLFFCLISIIFLSSFSLRIVRSYFLTLFRINQA